MDLIRLTFHKADGGPPETRLATSQQNVTQIVDSYLATIPGAVMCTRATIEKNIAADRAFWVYQAQALNHESAKQYRRGTNY